MSNDFLTKKAILVNSFIAILCFVNGIFVCLKSYGYNTPYGTCGSPADWTPHYHLIDNEPFSLTRQKNLYLNTTGLYQISYSYHGRSMNSDYAECSDGFHTLSVFLFIFATVALLCITVPSVEWWWTNRKRTRELNGREFMELV